MTTFVLVHGAFFGGWCWDAVSELLNEDGHTVIAPTLTGLAERSKSLADDIDLECHVRDVTDAIDQAPKGGLVLVGHSYGGMPTMAAADQRAGKIGAVLFLDAFVPRDGESAIAIRDAVVKGQEYHALPDLVGESVPPLPAEVFGLEGEMAKQVNARMTPHPIAAITQPIGLSGRWLQIPAKFYVRTTRFAAPYFDRTYRMLAIDPNWRTLEHDCGHCPMLSEPNWLAGILKDIEEGT